MPMRKRRSLGRKTVKTKAIEHTRAAEAPDEKEQNSKQIRCATVLREQLKLQNNINCDSSHNKFTKMHPEQLKHLFSMCALKWKGETPGMCGSSGAVKLLLILKPTEPLCSLLKGETAQSKDFVKHIRLFNNMFAMTSFKFNVVLNNG
ncbi:hypothetical protein TNCV_3621731 [Trichonephila clavipes]|nr:hypothetical protein TNCV_3621731 [Trichonephila clavipes]